MKLPAFDTPAGKLLRLPLRLVPEEATVRILRGPMRGMKWIAGASVHGCWLGHYEPEFQKLFYDLIPHNGVVWDVGANVGFYSLLASRKARKVLAIEPLPENLAYLRRHVALNGLEDRIEIHALAASNYEGEGKLRLIPGNRSEARLQPWGTLSVRTSRLDHLASDLPDVIKIDVEGSEVEVLEGMQQIVPRNHVTVLIALHGNREECHRLFGEMGYSAQEPQWAVLLATPRT